MQWNQRTQCTQTSESSGIKNDNYLLTTVLLTLKHCKFQMKTGPFSFFSYSGLKELAICHKQKVLLKTQSSGEKTEHYQPSLVIFSNFILNNKMKWSNCLNNKASFLHFCSITPLSSKCCCFEETPHTIRKWRNH